jgi:hypothetical protein
MFNFIVDGAPDNHQITTTLGYSTTALDSAANCINLYDNSTGITLTGANTDKYIAGSNGNIQAINATNIIGQGMLYNLSANTYYISLWAASQTGTTTVTSPKVSLVILKIS